MSVKKEAAQYAVVGGLCTSVDICVLFVLTSFLNINYLVASVASFLIGAGVNYLMCIKWVFSHSRKRSKKIEFAGHLGASAVALFVNTLLMWFFTSILGFFYIGSKLLVVMCTYLINFFLRRNYVHSVTSN